MILEPKHGASKKKGDTKDASADKKIINTAQKQMESENGVFRRLVKQQNQIKSKKNDNWIDIKIESHVAQTKDGYFLKIFRLY